MRGRDERPQREAPGVPRWVKVTGIVVAALVLLVLVAQLTGLGGDHGPGRHLPGGQPPAPAGGMPPPHR